MRRCGCAPEVLGNSESTEEESFSNGLLEYPQYTRPAEWQGRGIPEVLTSGNHKKIADWRRDESERLTAERRPDLWAAHVASRPRRSPNANEKGRSGQRSGLTGGLPGPYTARVRGK